MKGRGGDEKGTGRAYSSGALSQKQFERKELAEMLTA